MVAVLAAMWAVAAAGAGAQETARTRIAAAATGAQRSTAAAAYQAANTSVANAAAARARAPDTALASALHALVARERARFGIPGVAIALVVRDSVVLAEGYGWADSAAGRPARPDMAVPLAAARPTPAQGPMQAADSSPASPPLVARGVLWTLDGRRFAAPVAAGGWTSALDLARSRGESGEARDLEAAGFAAAVRVSRPDSAAAVVVVTLDHASAVAARMAEAALALQRASLSRQPLGVPDTTRPLPAGLARALAGRYGRAVELDEFQGRLFLVRTRGGIREEIRKSEDGALLTDDVAGAGTRLMALEAGDIVLGRDTLKRRPDLPPRPPAPEVSRLLGEYGPEEDPSYILEDDGRAVALLHRIQAYPLRRAASGYLLTGMGPLAADRLQVVSSRGVPRALVVGRDTLYRRLAPEGSGSRSFRIQPVRPIPELRREALAAPPPAQNPPVRQPDLVELRSLDRSIRYDIRYATSNNFMGAPMYTSAHAFLERPAAEALVRVAGALRGRGYGLLIHDAYRPWYVTRMFWDATPPAQHEFVADPARGSRHNRGCAVDLTLYDLASGTPLPMTGGYDEMSERSYARFPGGTSRQRWDRDLLRRAMEAEGFTVLDAEWWHFDYRDWSLYPVLNLTFEELAGGKGR